ncbi:MAG: isoprenylcysteine carboxylmethyltransferase family protein [Parvularculaceae bacterium]
MPPAWLPLAAIVAVIAVSAVRLLSVQSDHGVKAYGFGRHADIQRVAERNWRLAVAAILAFATIAWVKPEWELPLGRPDWAPSVALRWAASTLFLACFLIIAAAQIQMGASWRIGVPKEGPGALVAHGLFRWSRNPIFVGMIGTLIALFLWSPHIGTAAVLAATWTLVLIQVRIEEEALIEKHGAAYQEYSARVARWFGWRRRKSAKAC